MIRTDGAPLTSSDRATLLRQLDTLSNRGPDGCGSFIQDHVGFGHRRLAIRDRELGHQPWLSVDRQNVLTYNGELYNDDELRKELAGEYSFVSGCDTEVVMAAYLKWGRSCIKRFHGMFAFAMYDFRQSRLWLVRDRFGVKPLYFAQIGDFFVFGSQPSAIAIHPSYSKMPDWNVVSHYLSTTRLTLGSQSLYEGIQVLQPAHEMVIDGDRSDIHRYWNYPKPESSIDYEDAVDQLQEQLTTSIDKRLVSDVPVGMFLSGGVDSCTIASLFHEIKRDPFFAVCAGVESAGRDRSESEELSSAKICAKQFDIELGSVSMESDGYRNRWCELVEDFRFPLSTPSDVLIYELALAAKTQVGVVLGGEGSDELLCGYEVANWSGYDYDATLTGGQISHRPMRDSILRQYGRCCFKNESDHYFALNSLISTQAKKNVLNPEIHLEIDDDASMFAHYQSRFDSCGNLSTVEKYAIMLHQINLESLLSRLDKTTMHAGLEARVPFTDHDLVESVFRLPFHYRIDLHQGANADRLASAELSAAGRIRSKRPLRDVASRLLPKRLAARRKASFPTSVHHWFQHDWCRWISDYLAQSPFARFLLAKDFHGYLVASPHLAGMWLWPICNLSLWGDREFFDRGLTI